MATGRILRIIVLSLRFGSMDGNYAGDGQNCLPEESERSGLLYTRSHSTKTSGRPF